MSKADMRLSTSPLAITYGHDCSFVLDNYFSDDAVFIRPVRDDEYTSKPPKNSPVLYGVYDGLHKPLGLYSDSESAFHGFRAKGYVPQWMQ